MFLIENAIHFPDTFGTRQGVFIQLSTYHDYIGTTKLNKVKTCYRQNYTAYTIGQRT